ncbi:carbohydrate sulfotransferase 9-like [Homarus americanus]|uniref:Carbohydrate sulfotransferase n=1 Tax=Homarus americanus TaxID=6706 RepID=A0A8J5K0F2_HOMAM|nr:carbohydrate sulfotransferase 9-like [Homarus americanus]KAG7167850.1 Carbohydrate sulfotransferase 8-like 3 [Homarus americanus]
MFKMIKSLRLQRGGRWRVVRVGCVVLLLLCAWTAFSQNAHDLPSTTLSDKFSRSPNLQVAPPDNIHLAKGDHVHFKVGSPSEPHLLGERARSQSRPLEERSHALPHPLEEPIQINDQELKKDLRQDAAQAALMDSDNINPRYNVKAVKDKLEELKPKPFRNQIFFHQKQLEIPEGYLEEEYVDNYEEDQGDEEGKWKGRNRNEDENNVAVEEVDDPGAAKDDVGLEDVGGEAFKKRKGKNKKKHSKMNKKVEENNGENLKRIERKVNENKDMSGKMDLEIGGGHHVVHQNENVPVVPDHPDIEEDMAATEKDMALRRSKVIEVCGKYGLGPKPVQGASKTIKYPPLPNYDVFYIDRPDLLAWCPIYKAASTSWLYNFIKLAGLSESYIQNTKEQVSHVARKVWPVQDYEDIQQSLKVCLKFMIVRHPFERLVSAYRDKLENTNIGKQNGVDHFYEKFGKKIVDKYRPPGKGLPANRYSQDMDDPRLPHPKGIEPTFAEFVRYLIDTNLIYYADDHWMPYYIYCTPCLVDYEVIVKFETLDRDQNYIIRKNHLEKKIQPSWKHLTNGKKTSDTVKKYFATITKTELMKLYNKYKLDFELFSYSIDEYLDYVQQS